MSEDMKKVVADAMGELHKSFESKATNTQEELNKQNEIIKVLEEKQAESQKSFELKAVKDKELDEKAAKMQGDIESLFKAGSRASFGATDELKGHLEVYEKQMDTYYRTGVKPSAESLGDIAKHAAELTIKHGTDYDRELAVKGMAHELNGSDGYYLPTTLKAHVVGNNTDGGYLVTGDNRTDFIAGKEFETSPMRNISRVITTSNAFVDILVDDDESASGGWVNENSSRSTTDTAKLGKLSIFAHEQYAKPKVSQSMLDDASINIEQFIADKTNQVITRTENLAFVSGDGSAKPRGFLDYAESASSAYERDALERVNSGVSGQITADGLITLFSSLKESYQGNAVFLTKRVNFGEILKLKNGEGAYLLNVGRMLPDSAPMQLLGKSLLFADAMPGSSADSDSVAYGDFRQGYTIVDRFGTRTLRDPFTDKPNVIFYSTKRVGGGVTNYEAIKILKLAA